MTHHKSKIINGSNALIKGLNVMTYVSSLLFTSNRKLPCLKTLDELLANFGSPPIDFYESRRKL